MNTNGENEFYDVTINELLPLALKSWRKILLIGIIVAILLGLYKFFPLYNMANDSAFIASKVIEREVLQKSFEKTQNDLDLLENEFKESIYLNLEPSQITRGFMSYYIDTPRNDADLAYQKNLVNSYATYFISGEIYNQLANQLSEYIKPVYLSQIISVETSGLSSLDIYVLGENKNQTAEIMQLLEQAIYQKTSELSSLISVHTISLISKNITVTPDTEVFDDQEFHKQRLEILKTELTDKQSQLQNFEAELFTKKSALFSGLKFALIGLFAGIALAMTFFSVTIILSNKIKSRKQIINNYGVDVLGEFLQENNKRKRLDIYIGKLVGEPYDVPTEEIKLIIANNIVAISKSKKILIIGSRDVTNVEKVFDEISKCEILRDYDLGYNNKSLINSETLTNIFNYDSIILIVRKNKTSLNELQNAMYTFDSYRKDFVGVIFA